MNVGKVFDKIQHPLMIFLKKHGNFPGSSVVRTQCFHCQGPGSISGWGTKILHVAWPKNKR